MNLKHISDSRLRIDTKNLAGEERRISVEVLHHLREIDARKSFARWGHSSLYGYCIKELKYSGGGAHRRIASMKLLREVPEYSSKLQSGEVNVTTLSQVQSFLVQEKRQLKKTYSVEEKRTLLNEIEGKSSSQTERLFATMSPTLTKPEKERALNSEETEIRFTADRKLMEKLKRLKDLLGHKSDAQTYAGLIEELADLALKKLDPMEKKPSPTVEMEGKSRYIDVKTERTVWHRDQGQCTFIDADGKRCGSKHALQLEHIVPFAKGGKSTLSNLKLLCPAHNRLAAIHAYGLPKMQEFWAK